MIIKVGEKIRALRKALNMTQSELAGTEMTKSMLSQIENSISNPSMRTLHFLANKLNKPISYFLDDEYEANNPSLQNNKESKKELDNTINHISELIDCDKIVEAKKKLENLINDSTINRNVKSYADILFKLGNTSIKLGEFVDGKKYMNLSLLSYIEGDFYSDAAKAYMELARCFYEEFNYEECFNICNKAFELYYKNINTDPLLEIELYYFKILILSAIGDIENTIKSIETAISLSTKTSIYYKTDELYRLNGVFNYLRGNITEYKRSIEKALQFAKFRGDKICLAKIYTVFAIVSLESNDAEKALEYAETSQYYAEKELYIYYFIKGKAYYILGNYELAYENIIKVNFPSYEKHKFDYLNMWSSKIYEGLILNKLGKPIEGIESIKIGIEKMSIFNNSKFIINAYKSLSEVYSDMSDFENAFIYLKKANEIQDLINNDDSIVF